MGKFITLKIFCFKTGNAHGETLHLILRNGVVCSWNSIGVVLDCTICFIVKLHKYLNLPVIFLCCFFLGCNGLKKLYVSVC
jgi:hypothetical protein